jgi:hypothetical protein
MFNPPVLHIFKNVVNSTQYRSRETSVCIGTGYGLLGRGLIPGKENRLFSTPQRPDWLWGPPTLLFNGYLGGGGRVAGAWSWPHLDLVQRSRMVGHTSTPTYVFMSWCLIRENFTFLQPNMRPCHILDGWMLASHYGGTDSIPSDSFEIHGVTFHIKLQFPAVLHKFIAWHWYNAIKKTNSSLEVFRS